MAWAVEGAPRWLPASGGGGRDNGGAKASHRHQRAIEATQTDLTAGDARDKQGNNGGGKGEREKKGEGRWEEGGQEGRANTGEAGWRRQVRAGGVGGRHWEKIRQRWRKGVRGVGVVGLGSKPA